MNNIELLHSYSVGDEIIFNNEPPYTVTLVLGNHIRAKRTPDPIIDAEHIAKALDDLKELNNDFQKRYGRNAYDDPMGAIMARGFERGVNFERGTQGTVPGNTNNKH